MKPLTPVLASTTLIAGIMSAYLWQQLHAERLRTGVLQNRVTALELAQARTPVVAPSLAIEPTVSTVATPVTEQVTASVAAPPDAAATASKSPASVVVNSSDLMKDPDFRASVEASLRQSIGQAYPDLARELELSPEQARKLLDIIASNTISGMSMQTDAQGKTRVAANAREELQVRRDDEIRALLGDSKAQQWKSYEQSLSARQQVVRLRTTLESTGANMSQRQQQQLIATMAGEQKRQTEEMTRITQATGGPRNGPAAMEQMLQLTEESNRRILDASLGYLGPQQLDALKAQQNMETASTRAVLRAQRPRSEPVTASGP